MAVRVGILAAIFAIALGEARVKADATVGAGPVVRADALGRVTGVEATAGVALAQRGAVSGWWHVTGAIAHAPEATARELRVGPRFWRCDGGACIGAAVDVGLAETRDPIGGVDRAIVDGRVLVSIALDRDARVALVASAGLRGALAMTWDGPAPHARTERASVVGAMLVVRP